MTHLATPTSNKRSYSPLMKSIAAFVLVTFSWLILQPAALAARVAYHDLQRKAVNAPSEQAAMAQALSRIKKLLETIQRKIEKGEPIESDRVALVELRSGLDDLNRDAMEGFERVEAHITAHGLPDVIKQRHKEAVSTYRNDMALLKGYLDAIRDAEERDALKATVAQANRYMADKKQELTPQTVDPDNLPFRMPDSKVREPMRTSAELQASLPPSAASYVAAAELLPGMLVTSAATTPTPADLSATEDVQITADIQDLAAQLGHDPVAIFNWMRNNIIYVPTYGSIQGSQLTLDTRRGNAFDTASLLLALLRASNVPARYAYGTVRIPVNQVMNWVGGVETPEAAQQLLGQGGVPNVGITEGGIIKFIDMEHIWVEAWVDFVPSRGAKHVEGDSWVPMDASFKQYQYVSGVNLEEAVPFTGQALVEQALAGAQYNEQEGSVSGVDDTLIIAAAEDYRADVLAYVDSNPAITNTFDLIGGRTVVKTEPAVLAAGLPYQLLAEGARYAELPSSMRHKLKYDIYASSFDYSLGSPTLSLVESLPKLAGKKITLSFVPASDADAATLNSYLPDAPPGGGVVDPNLIPSELPGYLINMVAELRVDGTLVARGGNFTMGTELVSRMGVYDPAFGWEYAQKNNPVVGDYIATGLNLQGTSGKMLDDLDARLLATEAKVDAGQFADITREDTVGDVLYATVLGYYASNDAYGEVLARTSGVVSYRKPSFGNFLESLTTNYWFGIPRSVTFGGLVMDIDRHISITAAKNNNHDAVLNFQQLQGMRLSALEHETPEQYFTTPQEPGQAVSAVRALNMASAQGQKIFTVNSGNVSTVLPLLSISPDVKSEIQSSVAAGKEAVVSQGNITSDFGWTGVGYIIKDPLTGSAAYKISGGRNGGDLIGFLSDFTSALADGVVSANFKQYVGLFGAGFGAMTTFFELLDADCGVVESMVIAAMMTALSGWLTNVMIALLPALSFTLLGLIAAIILIYIINWIVSLIVGLIVSGAAYNCRNR